MNVSPVLGEHVRIREGIIPASEMKYSGLIRQRYDYSCGAATLATLLNYHLGESFSEQQVIHGLLEYGDSEKIARRRAFSLLDMKKFATVLGYKSAGYRAEISDIKDSQYWPCIVRIKVHGYSHFVVFKGIHKGHVFFADPWSGNTSYTIGDFERIWDDNIMFIVSNGKMPVLKGLRIKKKDLNFIDEDSARMILQDRQRPFNVPALLDADQLFHKHKTYRP